MTVLRRAPPHTRVLPPQQRDLAAAAAAVGKLHASITAFDEAVRACGAARNQIADAIAVLKRAVKETSEEPRAVLLDIDAIIRDTKRKRGR